MRSTICAVIILVFIVAGGILSTKALENFSSELYTLTNNVYTFSLMGDYEEAEKNLDKVDSLIEEKKVLIGSMIDHVEFEKIELNFQKLRVYVKERIPMQIKTYCRILDYQIELLPKDYKLKAENIL